MKPAESKRKAEAPISSMCVKKRDGTLVPVDLNKILRAVSRCSNGLAHVDPMRVATKTISGLYDGATTRELDFLSIQTASSLIFEHPEYSKLAARLLAVVIEKEVRGQEIESFSQYIEAAYKENRINGRVLDFVRANQRKLNNAIDRRGDDRFEYFGLRTLYDRYFVRHPITRKVMETSQYFWMRIACALSKSIGEAIELYDLLSDLDYVPSTPTLFNAGTCFEQLSSCFLLDSPADDLLAIYNKYTDVALLSKFSGGIGVGFTRPRSRGSLIRSTNGHSNGIVPWIKTLDTSVAAVNQGGKRAGACAVYVETWHADIEEFLELKDNTGDPARRTYNLNLANWVPDLFMHRVSRDEDWSLFDPKDTPDLTDLYGEAFQTAYLAYEAAGVAKKTVKARDLYAKMMRTLAQTGSGWMCFKDRANKCSNQTGEGKNIIHLSNLCTEILEVSSDKETAVCNLGSINLSRHLRDGALDIDKLHETVRIAVRQLDAVIDLNLYQIDSAHHANMGWRPVGLGLMGLQDVFFQKHLPFDSEEARSLSTQIQEEIYFAALTASCDLAKAKGAHPRFSETRAAQGALQFDHWAVDRINEPRWNDLREKIKKHGLRNSLLIAIAPTATIASIVGCYECIEPQVSNLFKRETLSGDFLQINHYLVNDLRQRGLWNEETRAQLKANEGSIQAIDAIPSELKAVYRTVWEIPMRSLIDMAVARGAFIDQSQSLNLFMENPSIGALSSMYMYAWTNGIKTTYYLRSRPATKIAKTTVSDVKPVATDEEAVACSLENPEACQACQ